MLINSFRLCIFNLIVLNVLVIVSSGLSKQTISSDRSQIRLVDYQSIFREEPNNYEDEYERSEWANRRGLISIDAFNLEKCGNANFADGWMKTLNSFECEPSKSNGTRRRKANNRISGGYFPNPGDFPSMVQVKYVGRDLGVVCGGVIIHNNLVLTAAHCLFPQFTYRNGLIIAGSISVDNADRKGVQVRLAGQCRCPTYNNTPYACDWAVLLLSKPLRYSKTIQPACLDFWRAPALNVACVTSGFGKFRGDQVTDRLRASIMSPCWPEGQKVGIPGTTCYQRYHNRTSSANSCHGDSGSPMYCFDNCSAGNTKMYAVGVLFAKDAVECYPEANIRSFFADVYKHGQSGMYQQMQNCIRKMRARTNIRWRGSLDS